MDAETRARAWLDARHGHPAWVEQELPLVTALIAEAQRDAVAEMRAVLVEARMWLAIPVRGDVPLSVVGRVDALLARKEPKP